MELKKQKDRFDVKNIDDIFYILKQKMNIRTGEDIELLEKKT
jgi:hypothetical protein